MKGHWPIHQAVETGNFSMRDKLFKLLGLALFVVSLSVGWVLMEVDAFAHRAMEVMSKDQRIDIPAGSSLASVAEHLYAHGLIDSPQYFIWYSRWHGAARKLRAGQYAVEAGMTPRMLLDRIITGQVLQHSLTLVEGWNFRQVINAVHATDTLQHTLTNLSDAEIMSRIGAEGVHPEGQFFPDTYQFPTDTNDVEFLKRAYAAMQIQLQEAWKQRSADLPLVSPYEVLILASIIEKETAVVSERPDIAGVFIRRLKVGMRLQTDPTVIYGMGDRYTGDIRREDLVRDTPYNTYTRKGLPPTPIAMPGQGALLAAVRPAAGDALFFVARGDGSHQFSATLEQHNQAVRDYLNVIKAQP